MTQSDRQLYLRLKNKLDVQPGQSLCLEDVAQVLVADTHRDVLRLEIYTVPRDEHLVVLDVMDIMQKVVRHNPQLQIEALGNEEIILEVKQKGRSPSRIALFLVWMVLFVGSGLAIMNFHTDVSMLEVHQRIHYLITGETTERPLWIQIPYSFGIGLGMVLFFNHVFRRRFNEEPTPLEVEMNLYQENVDQYIKQHEHSKGRQS